MSDDDSETRPGTVADALTKAEEAIKRLDEEPPRSERSDPLVVVAGLLVGALAVAGLVIHTWFEDESPQVDETTVLLLAVLLLAPATRHLRSLELGGAKAEWREENVEEGLKQVHVAVKAQHEAMKRVYAEMQNQSALEAPEEVSADTTPPASPDRPGGPVRPLRRVLWVDDRQQGNEYELSDLRKLFTVVTAGTADEVDRLLSRADVDAVITDAVRPTPAGLDLRAGLAVVARARTADPPVAAFVYTSEQYREMQEAALLDAGANLVTSSYVELVKGLRREARARFDATVRQVLREVGDVTEQVADVDFVVRAASGRTVLVETPHWLRRPKASAVTARFDKLRDQLREQQADAAVLVTQKELLSPDLDRAAPPQVRVVPLEQLGRTLHELLAPA